MTNKKETKKKYTLSFVNNGEPFELSNWTMKKHKEVLATVANFEKNLSEKELDEKYRHLLILKGLQEVDPSVKESDLDLLHPEDLLALFAAIYYTGRKGILVKDFRQTQKDSKK